MLRGGDRGERDRRSRRPRKSSEEDLLAQRAQLPLPPEYAATPIQQRQAHQRVSSSSKTVRDGGYPDRRRSGSGSGSGSSADESTSGSSLLDISRDHPAAKRFANPLAAFFKAPSEHRRRKKKRTRFLRFGNSSSDTVNSDLAYGNGYIKRPKGHRRHGSLSSTTSKTSRTGAGGSSSSSSSRKSSHSHHGNRRMLAAGLAAGSAVSRLPAEYGHRGERPQLEYEEEIHGKHHGRKAGQRFKIRKKKSDEEILELGRQLSQLAKEQNIADQRAAGARTPSNMTSTAQWLHKTRVHRKQRKELENFLHGRDDYPKGHGHSTSRGIGMSRPHSDSFSDDKDDDDEWEDMEEGEDSSSTGSSSDYDSGLVYGSAQSSGENLPRPYGSSEEQLAYGGWRPYPNRNVVDPRLMGPANSIRPFVDAPCGFEDPEDSTWDLRYPPRQHGSYGQQPPELPQQLPQQIPQQLPQLEYDVSSAQGRPMRVVHPMPTSDPAFVDIDQSVVSGALQSESHSRPRPVPIQPADVQIYTPRPLKPAKKDSIEASAAAYGSPSRKPSVGKSSTGKKVAAGVGTAVATGIIASAITSEPSHVEEGRQHEYRPSRSSRDRDYGYDRDHRDSGPSELHDEPFRNDKRYQQGEDRREEERRLKREADRIADEKAMARAEKESRQREREVELRRLEEEKTRAAKEERSRREEIRRRKAEKEHQLDLERQREQAERRRQHEAEEIRIVEEAKAVRAREERRAREAAERDRIAREKEAARLEHERIEREASERRAIAREEAARLEHERIEREASERRAIAREEADRAERERFERIEREAAERQRVAEEEAAAMRESAMVEKKRLRREAELERLADEEAARTADEARIRRDEEKRKADEAEWAERKRQQHVQKILEDLKRKKESASAPSDPSRSGRDRREPDSEAIYDNTYQADSPPSSRGRDRRDSDRYMERDFAKDVPYGVDPVLVSGAISGLRRRDSDKISEAPSLTRTRPEFLPDDTPSSPTDERTSFPEQPVTVEAHPPWDKPTVVTVGPPEDSTTPPAGPHETEEELKQRVDREYRLWRRAQHERSRSRSKDGTEEHFDRIDTVDLDEVIGGSSRDDGKKRSKRRRRKEEDSVFGSKPNSDNQFDNQLYPVELVGYKKPQDADFFPKPVLNLILPTPSPSPAPERQVVDREVFVKEPEQEHPQQPEHTQQPEHPSRHVILSNSGEVIEVGPKPFDADVPESKSVIRTASPSDADRKSSASRRSWGSMISGLVGGAIYGAAATTDEKGNEISGQAEKEFEESHPETLPSGEVHGPIPVVPVPSPRAASVSPPKSPPQGLADLDDMAPEIPYHSEPKPPSSPQVMPGSFDEVSPPADIELAAAAGIGLRSAGLPEGYAVDDPEFINRKTSPGSDPELDVYRGYPQASATAVSDREGHSGEFINTARQPGLHMKDVPVLHTDETTLVAEDGAKTEEPFVEDTSEAEVGLSKKARKKLRAKMKKEAELAAAEPPEADAPIWDHPPAEPETAPELDADKEAIVVEVEPEPRSLLEQESTLVNSPSFDAQMDVADLEAVSEVHVEHERKTPEVVVAEERVGSKKKKKSKRKKSSMGASELGSVVEEGIKV